MNFESILQELGSRWGLPINLESRAIAITDNNGTQFQLEYPENGEIFTVYTLLDHPLSDSTTMQLLKLNSDRNLLGCAWLSLLNNKVCLGVSLPSDLISINELENLFSHMQALQSSISSHLKEETEQPLSTHNSHNPVFI